MMVAFVVHVSGDLRLGEILVGVGTLMLAGFTLWLAGSTRASVRQAALAVEAEDMPYVIGSAVPEDSSVAIEVGKAQFPRCGVVEWNGLRFVARLWNVGRGPAIVEDVRLTLTGTECLDAVISHRPISANGVHDTLWGTFHAPGDDWESRELVGTLEIVYAHANGSLWKTASQARLKNRKLTLDTFPRSKATSTDVRRSVSDNG